MRRASALAARAARIETLLGRLLVAAALGGSAPALAGAQQVDPPGALADAQRLAEPAPLDEAELVGPPAGRPIAGEELESRTLALATRMRCPVCQGLSIADSPSASALAMLSQTRDLLARGYTEEQVLDYFVRAYGEFVLLEPTKKGFNLAVWLLPVAALLAGAGLIAHRLRSARRGRGSGDGPGSGAGGGEDLAPYLERVRSELRS